MKRIAFLLLLVCYDVIVYAQQGIKAFVNQHAVPIATIDPSDIDFKDLHAIGTAIGDASVVMLGEQDHGDAPTFLAKIRLIKYLHQEKGFSVLAMESDFFSLNPGWDELRKDKPSIDSFLMKNIFGVWTMCSACQPLLKYIPESFQSGNPLQITGFDNQLYFSYSYRNLFRKLDSVLKYYQLPVTAKPEYESEILPVLKTFHQNKTGQDTSLFFKREQLLREIRLELAAKTAPTDFWLLVIDNLIQLNEMDRYEKKDYWKRKNARDLQMARNLAWLCDVKYPQKKIIVWAHNSHISKYSGHYPEEFLNNAKYMGYNFTQDTVRMKNTYILGFTSGEGTAGRVGTSVYSLPRTDKGGFESWVNPEYQQAFTDFRLYNNERDGDVEMFSMAGSIKGPALHTVHKAFWTRIFDGVFYIRKMYPCVSNASF